MGYGQEMGIGGSDGGLIRGEQIGFEIVKVH